MTPQLQQAIKLLQLSNVELVEFVEQELETNPLLERDESGEGAAASAQAPPGETAERPSEAPPEAPPDSLEHAVSETLPEQTEQPLDTDYEPGDDAGPEADWASDESAFGTWSAARGAPPENGESLEQRLGEEVSLRQHLLRQLQMDLDDPVDRMIGVHLIDMLDEAGYILGDLAALAELLGCEPARVEETLLRLQRFEPPGIFARSLKECLALQLADRDRLDPAMAALLDNLDLLASRDLAKLKKLCGVDDEDLSEMVAEIRALNPKPALEFDHQVAAPVVPDILMRPHPAGGWQIELNAETLPRILANGDYYARVTAQCRDKAEKEYVVERFQSANWLVKSLNQRANTILKVASEIVRRQEGFFRKGVRHLRPLTLRDVAEEIEMHESTVSRATSNKYIATPRGTYELKYFFTTSIAGTGAGDSHSAEAVRDRIKEMIDAEDAKKVLSDDSIVELLRKDGIEIARRTVAKYREAMRIPSSVQRRREKSLQP
jgi:RNA polymerase sigma-54 factor